MEVDGSASYDNSHRAFLQVFLAKSVLTFDQAKPLLAAIMTAQGESRVLYVLDKYLTVLLEDRETLENDITEADFNNYVSVCNNAISPFDLEIRSTLSQHDRKRVFAIVNTTSDPATQLATTHTADEISYLKRVLDAMFETYNSGREEIMAITSLQALRLSRAPTRETQNGEATQGASGQGLTTAQAERMLDSLVAEGWFELSKKNYYSLTPRALMELRGWLLETYNESREDEDDEDEEETVDRIKLCQACRDIVTVVSRELDTGERD